MNEQFLVFLYKTKISRMLETLKRGKQLSLWWSSVTRVECVLFLPCHCLALWRCSHGAGLLPWTSAIETLGP